MSTIPSLQDPVTTTKALLLHVVTPRTFVKACDTTPTTPLSSPPPKERKKPKLKTLLERKSTGDEASLSTAVASALREDPNECGTNNLASPPPPPPAAAELGEREYSEEVTREEAAAVTIQAAGDSDDEMGGAVDTRTTIINMEELLRIAFHKLALEWHLLNVPTYSVVAQLSKLVVAEPQDDDEEGRDGSLHFRIEIQEPSYNDMEDADSDCIDEWVQVSVMVRPASLELVLGRLERIGVGSNCGTVTVLKAELCRTASPLAHQMPIMDPTELLAEAPNGVVHPEVSQDPADPNVNNEQKAKERAIEAAKQEWKNAATRLRIEQVREQIVEQAAFSLDFIALLTVASILAAVGLITDNTVVIVASMLVSPIMGPVLGLTFGTRIRDWPLVRSSLWHEILALVGCVIIGMLVGLPSAFTSLASDDWPTNEMRIRGEPIGLVTGVAIALPSGMGVCLSILGGNTSSLVGVAISASLLPPAVNAGICLIYALLLQVGAVEDADAGRFAIIGAISFALTVVNILCIWFAGLIMFQIKQVAPAEQKNAFWSRDLQVARELNQNNEKPPPIDVTILRQGVQYWEQQRNPPSTASDVRYRPSKAGRNGADGTTLAAAFATNAKTHRRKWSGSLWNGTAGADTKDVEQQAKREIQFVGLEDMGTLLGFDQEDESEGVNPAEVARRLGKGRYL